jgi:hypothetical protein
MERGEQTIKMVKALIIYALKEYPEFNYVGFMEKSERVCESHDVKMDLAEYHYWLTFKTWYQTHFQAVPDPMDTALESGLLQLQNRLNKPVVEDLSSIFFRTGDSFPTQSMKMDFMYLYEGHKSAGKSWNTFLKSVFSRESEYCRKYGFPAVCALFEYVNGKLSNLLDIRLRLGGTLWQITRDTVESYPEYKIIRFREGIDPKHVRRMTGGVQKRFTNKVMRRNKSARLGYGCAWRKLSYGKHMTMKKGSWSLF